MKTIILIKILSVLLASIVSALSFVVAYQYLGGTEKYQIPAGLTILIPGDLNGDGVVDIVDAALVSAHWYPGPPVGPLGYDPHCDIDGDGRIDIYEASVVSAYWTGPPKGPLDH